MKKALYLHGFLGGLEDMEPLFVNDYECICVDIKALQDQPEYLLDLYPGPFEFAVAYSFGGRFLAKVLNLKSNYVNKPIFCSSKITGYSVEELKSREKLKNTLLEKLHLSLEDFFTYWRDLSLFNGHSMEDYRAQHNLPYKSWTQQEIVNFLEHHFTYSTLSLDAFKNRSWFLYGENDLKYKKEVEKLKMNFFEFKGLGHRFLFENPQHFKEVLVKKVL